MSSFREQLIGFARTGVARAGQCRNEEGTKLYLVVPFLRLLGYDANDPDHVVAEHSADFSEKYKNRVDFLVKANGEAAIALECKPCGVDLKADRGQIMSYFNALSGDRIGGLTNGLDWEFFIDSVEPNKMDEEPFLSFSLTSFANGAARAEEIEALEQLSRERFDIEQIISKARARLLKENLVRSFGDEIRSPSDELIRLFLQKANQRYVRRNAMERTYRGLMKAAIAEALTRQVWSRLQTQHQMDASTRSQESTSGGVETTEEELYVYSYCTRRLAFLVRDEALFNEIDKVGYRDFASKFVVFYDKVRQGKLFEFYEGDDGKTYILFPNDLGEFDVSDDLTAIDEPLLAIFRIRVRELTGP
jgi:predicted type IV restriction endonuclease